jgi:CheY-like chemotaxis protein
MNPVESLPDKESLQPTAEPDKKAKRIILLVEDDPFNYKFMIALLTQKKYAEVILAKSGIEAVEKCQQHPEINLVLMDIKLPGINGYEATRRIKSFRERLPVIAITAYAMSGDESKAIEAGCDDYITKPVSKELLIAKIERFSPYSE